MAHAAQKTVVTVEKIHDGDLLRDPLLAAGTLPGFYVEAVAVAAARRLAARRCPTIIRSMARMSRNMRALPPRRKALPRICSATFMSALRSSHERHAA